MQGRYRPSGFFNPALLVLAFAALVPVAGLLSWGLSLALNADVYFIIFIPALASAPLAVAGRTVVRWSHLRNPIVAFMVGAALAVLMYVGQHYATMITLLGPQAIPRIDVFPRFLIAAVDNMVISDSIDQGKPVPWLNWITFWTELVMCGFIAGVAWYLAAGRPYCEQCHRWLGVTTTRLKVGSARQLVAALKADALETLPTLQALFAERPECYGQLEVSGCMHGREGEDAIIFATVSEITFRNKRWETQKLIDLAALSPDELTTIYDRCPSLQVEPCEVA